MNGTRSKHDRRRKYLFECWLAVAVGAHSDAIEGPFGPRSTRFNSSDPKPDGLYTR
jgi:hypothetical protein